MYWTRTTTLRRRTDRDSSNMSRLAGDRHRGLGVIGDATRGVEDAADGRRRVVLAGIGSRLHHRSRRHHRQQKADLQSEENEENTEALSRRHRWLDRNRWAGLVLDSTGVCLSGHTNIPCLTMSLYIEREREMAA